MTAAQFRVYFVLFFLALASWFLADIFEPESEPVVDIIDHSPDYFSLGYYKKEMDQQGLVKNELNAEKMTHYGDDLTTHLEKPVMVLYNAELPPWVIESDTAVLEADGDHLQLSGNVVVSREGNNNLRPFKLTTKSLKVQLSKHHAETEDWLRIVDDRNRTDGVGAVIRFVDPVRIKFLSKVKGRYVFN